MMTSTELEFDIREVMDEKLGLGRRMAACQRIADHDQEQRAVIEQLQEQLRLANIDQLNTESEVNAFHEERLQFNAKIEQQAKENTTLREALQAICFRAPIMGSRGEYRAGQLDALEAVRLQAQHALKEVSG